ncbi:unnamed protein product [Cylicocyclus nassatus]|uniref:Uncharacterized protein n=1 Tax=Cylicocyclus nassatus TaxID=53992 RepID=A0AA36DR10_CYLNA|nr:unnamed protein product [Cylicocyclus nassatus]
MKIFCITVAMILTVCELVSSLPKITYPPPANSGAWSKDDIKEGRNVDKSEMTYGGKSPIYPTYGGKSPTDKRGWQRYIH